MAAPINIDLDTELSAVNSILGAIGQAPVTALATTENRKYTVDYTQQDGTPAQVQTQDIPELVFEDPQVAFVYQLLMECNLDTQIHGWVFNTESWYEIQPTIVGTEQHILFPSNVLRYDVSDGQVFRTSDVVRRTDPSDGKSKLYDKKTHSYDFTDRTPIYLDVVWYWEWMDLPQAFKRWIVHQACVKAATQMVSNPQLVQMLTLQEQKAMTACQQYETEQGDYSYFGWPAQDNVVYNSYQPYRTLMR